MLLLQLRLLLLLPSCQRLLLLLLVLPRSPWQLLLEMDW